MAPFLITMGFRDVFDIKDALNACSTVEEWENLTNYCTVFTVHVSLQPIFPRNVFLTNRTEPAHVNSCEA